MRRHRRISEFGEAEFLGASFHDAPQSARQSLAALPFPAAQRSRTGSLDGLTGQRLSITIIPERQHKDERGDLIWIFLENGICCLIWTVQS